jgi:hypothetical protein
LCNYKTTIFATSTTTKNANNMNTLALIIEGTYTSNIQTLEWECPFTGNKKNAWGEFNYNGDYYSHDVYDENDNVVYTVLAK